MTEQSSQPQSPKPVGKPLVAIAWDPSLITEEQYAELIVALGNLIRAEGGVGIERLREKGLGLLIGEGASV